MSRARAVVGGLLLVLIAAPAYAAPPSHSYERGELLGPVTDYLLEPLDNLHAPLSDPLVDPVEEVADPITDPVEPVTDPITDPILDPVEVVVDPIIDQAEGVIDPPLERNPPPVGGGNLPGDSPILPFGRSGTGGSVPVEVAGSLAGPVPSSAADLVSSAVSLLPPPSAGVVLSPTLAQNVLSQILDWLSGVDAGSFLRAPFLGLQVLLRALASAGQGLFAPGLMLAVFAVSMARERRIQGTKTA